MQLSWLACLASIVPLVACAEGGHRPPSAPIGVSAEPEQSEFDEPVVELEPVSENLVLQVARPFHGIRTLDSRKLAPELLLTHLAEFDAICFGERHDSALDHYAQLRVISGLLERRPLRGFELGVGLEMVRQRFQSVLTDANEDFLLGDQLVEQTHWETEWGFPVQHYRPQLVEAARGQSPLLALGVDRELTQTIAKGGIQALSPEQSSQLPEMELGVAEHRELFDAMMAGHPGHGHGNQDDFYAAQVVWDESMAEVSAAFLSGRAPARKLLVIAGAGHCHESAIPRRIERRGDFRVASVVVREQGEADAPRATLLQAYDYQIVFEGQK